MGLKGEFLPELWRRLNSPSDRRMATRVAYMVLVIEVFFCLGIIWKVPYTEIDWEAYMEQIRTYKSGVRDYTQIQGGTGPLVYPAGHVHIFSWIETLTGGSVALAQWLFGVVYLVTQAVVLWTMVWVEILPPWALGLLACSKRLHSIYLLRLFNDCWAMLFAHAATALMVYRNHNLAIVVYSVAVSVKMNVLLYAPGVLAIMLHQGTLDGLVVGVITGILVQVGLALPFLLSHPREYVSRAFQLTRTFLYEWTVNLKFLPEHIFLHPSLHLGLLFAHVVLLVYLWRTKWGPQGTTLRDCLRRMVEATQRSTTRSLTEQKKKKKKEEKKITTTTTTVSSSWLAPPRDEEETLLGRQSLYMIATANFVGVLCARSLHFQFYSWYFHSLVAILWMIRLPTVVRLGLLGVIEYCWNRYPSTDKSSLTLLAAHSVVFAATVWSTPPRIQAQKHKAT